MYIFDKCCTHKHFLFEYNYLEGLTTWKWYQIQRAIIHFVTSFALTNILYLKLNMMILHNFWCLNIPKDYEHEYDTKNQEQLYRPQNSNNLSSHSLIIMPPPPSGVGIMFFPCFFSYVIQCILLFLYFIYQCLEINRWLLLHLKCAIYRCKLQSS